MSSSRPHSRSASASSSRSIGAGEGVYREPGQAAAGEFDFCNAFWVFPAAKPQQADSQDKADWGRQGVEALLGRMRVGTKTLDELRAMFKDR